MRLLDSESLESARIVFSAQVRALAKSWLTACAVAIPHMAGKPASGVRLLRE